MPIQVYYMGLTGFPKNYLRNTVEYFNKNKDDLIIPEWVFGEWKLIIVWVPFSESNEKFILKALSKSLFYLQIIDVNLTLSGTPEILDHSFKLKIMSNSTAAWFMKIIIHVAKTMLMKSGVKITLCHQRWPNIFATWLVINFPIFKFCSVILWRKNWKLFSSFLGFKVIYQRSRNKEPIRCLFTT